jgi:hypothetical protein
MGDYQFLTAVGDSVFGAFAGRGNVVDPSTGIDTTGFMDPFFFTATAPTVPAPATVASALVAVLMANEASASSPGQPGILPTAAATAPAPAGTPGLDATSVDQLFAASNGQDQTPVWSSPPDASNPAGGGWGDIFGSDGSLWAGVLAAA